MTDSTDDVDWYDDDVYRPCRWTLYDRPCTTNPMTVLRARVAALELKAKCQERKIEELLEGIGGATAKKAKAKAKRKPAKRRRK